MHQVYNLLNVFLIRDSHALCILDTTVQVDGKHTLGTGTYATCAKCIRESVIGNLVTQTAAAGQGVCIVADIGKE